MNTRKKIPNPYTQVGGGLPQIEYAETEVSTQEDGENEKRKEPGTEKTTERQNDTPTPTTKEKPERATIEVSLYLTPSLDEKLEDLRREYKRRTGKRIMPNKIMRILIEQATIDDLFSE
jgi:hypothetical protein